MYELTSRNSQRRRDSGVRSTLPAEDRARIQREQVEQRLEADLQKIKDAAYRPRLGAWPLERFGAIMANLSYWCTRCDHSIMPPRAAAFAAFAAEVPEKTQLIKVRKAVTCAKCGGQHVAVGSHIPRATIWPGPEAFLGRDARRQASLLRERSP
jgi:hypothetical protein